MAPSPRPNLEPTLPPIPPELVSALDRLVPHRCPDPKMSDRDIWLYAGKRALVDYLQAMLAQQNDNLAA